MAGKCAFFEHEQFNVLPDVKRVLTVNMVFNIHRNHKDF